MLPLETGSQYISCTNYLWCEMEMSLYQFDAFASKLFEGNPAAVCPLDEWISDELMQSIAFARCYYTVIPYFSQRISII